MNEIAPIAAKPSGSQLIGMVANPFQRAAPEHLSAGTVAIESERAIAEAQSKLIIAKRFPRDETMAYNKIVSACHRAELAETAFYAYKRGGQKVTGPSIRLAEELARCWGNMEYKLRELSRRHGESEMEAFAWDYETNSISSHSFTVRHLRDRTDGAAEVTSERDIYEVLANHGARRMRARILALLPSWYVDAAVAQCTKTIAGDSSVPHADRLRLMVDTFGKMGVTPEMIMSRLGHPLSQTTPDELTELRGIATSLKDGASKVSEWFSPQRSGSAFDAPQSTAPAATKTAETRTAVEPGQAEQKPPGDSGEAEFEAYLLDGYGEPIAGPDEQPLVYGDPVVWARALVNTWLASDAKDSMRENNADSIDDASQRSAEAAEILTELAEPPPEQESDPLLVPVPTTLKGAAHVPNYKQALAARLARVSANEMMAFAADNAPNIIGLPSTAMLQCVQIVNQRCAELGITPPKIIPEKPAASGEAADRRRVEDFKAQIDGCKTVADVQALGDNVAMRTVIGRLDREQPAMAEEVRAHAANRIAELRGLASPASEPGDPGPSEEG